MVKRVHQLKSCRRYSGFSQHDVARLVGISSHWSVSRHERSAGTVLLKTALAYEIIYQKPIAEIFGGAHTTIRRAIVRRAKALLEDLVTSGNAARDAQRKESLHAIVATA